MKRRIFYTEAAWLLGVVLLALGTALMERGGFGISIVVAPAYILHLASGLSFGAAEFILQGAVLLLLLAVLRKARWQYFLSFATALLYGTVLDGAMLLVGGMESLWLRVVSYIAGELLCAVSISLMFHAYLPPAVYELFVREVSRRKGADLYRFKTGYDIASCAVAAAMSLLCFGTIRGIGIGTLACTLLNGLLIRFFSNFWEKHWQFRDALPLQNILAKET